MDEKVKKSNYGDESKKKEDEKYKIEVKVENIEKEIAEIDETMAVSGLDYQELTKLYYRKEGLNKELEEVMEIWLSLSN